MINKRWIYQLRSFLPAFLLFVMPASTTYEMHDAAVGAFGSGVLDSDTYSAIGFGGEVGGVKGVGATYNLGPGLVFTRQANVPQAPTFTNPSTYYNKLHFVLATSSNPTDTKYAVAVSNDNFATTYYVQSDHTLGVSAVYQTYAAWGGDSGAIVIGLTPNTTYAMKVKAVHTKYTETEFSPTATAATVGATLTYDIDVASSDSESAPPYTVTMGTLTPGSVTTATSKIWIDLATNAENGAFVYAYDTLSGLRSTNANYTITSLTTNLASVFEGYGLQVASVGQTSGGPLLAVSPYNGALENVGAITTTSQTVFTSSNAPIIGGRGSMYLKAKSATTTPAAEDYADTITLIASGSF